MMPNNNKIFEYTLENCFLAKEELLKEGFSEDDFYLADFDFTEIGYLLGEPMFDTNDDFCKSAFELYKEKLFSEQNDDAMLDYFLENEPVLTEEEHQQKMIELDKACDFVLKNKITPNMDGIY